MALVKCKSCGHEVDKSAKACPSCGAKHPGVRAKDMASGCLVAIVLLVLVGWGLSRCSGSDAPADPNDQARIAVIQACHHALKDREPRGVTFDISVLADSATKVDERTYYQTGQYDAEAGQSSVHMAYVCKARLAGDDAGESDSWDVFSITSSPARAR